MAISDKSPKKSVSGLQAGTGFAESGQGFVMQG